MAAPRWARALARQVALDHGRAEPPRLYWDRESDGKTLGGCQPPDLDSQDAKLRAGEIFIAEGLDEPGERYILIHELAHWLLPAREGHGFRFNQTASELYRQHMPPFSPSVRPLYLKTATIE